MNNNTEDKTTSYDPNMEPDIQISRGLESLKKIWFLISLGQIRRNLKAANRDVRELRNYGVPSDEILEAMDYGAKQAKQLLEEDEQE